MSEAVDYKQIFNSLPGVYLVLLPDSPDFTIAEMNESRLQVTMGNRSSIGKPLFDVYTDDPDNPFATGVSNLRKSLETVLLTKQPNRMDIQRYDILNPHTNQFEIKYWKPLNIPVHDEQNNIRYIIHIVEDITEKLELEKKLENEQQKRQKQITEAVLIAQENERVELGRELHDNINQILITTRLYLDLALSRPSKDEELLNISKDHIGKAIRELRRLSRNLMPPSLGDITLKQSLEDLLLNFSSFDKVNFNLDVKLNEEKFIPDFLKITIYRIIQEQLANILRHSGATIVNIKIFEDDHSLYVNISDNGIGFDTNKSTSGLGLKNISSRASLLEGHAEIISTPGKGTRLSIVFPLT